MDILTPRAALLLELARKEGYGLELMQRVAERSKGEIRLTQATVYPELRAMERERLLESWESDPLPERGGRPRRYYRLTSAGRRAARDAVTRVESMVSGEFAWS